MNGLHDNPHKRTSITELLNPVASSPSGSLDAQYGSNQLNGLPSPSYGPSPHQQHMVAPPSFHPSLGAPGSSFSLRAASWDQASNENQLGSQRRQDTEPSSCRFGSPASHQVNSHPVYPEHYQRPRAVDEPSPNYSMDVSPWSPNSHEQSPTSSYNAAMVSPIYSDERTSISGDPIPKNYPPPQMQMHYEQQEMHPQQYFANGYFPIMFGHPASRAMQPTPAMLQQHRGQPQPMYLPPHLNHLAFAAIPFMMPPPTMPKRTLESEDDSSAPKSKRAKAKAKPAEGNGNSRRGYNSKKRNEAAQMAAQNAQMTPGYTQGNGKGKEKAGAVLVTTSTTSLVGENGLPLPDGGHALHPELQFARCMSNRYRSEEFPRCVSCTRRWAGDTCRFQGIRFFLKDEKRNIVGISFIENHKPDGPSMNFPVKWNIPLQLSHMASLKLTVAKALLPVLQQEQEHMKHPEVIRRNRESEVRATCDTCMTSIFASSWMCRLCGREACSECFAQVSELTVDRQGASDAEIAQLQARREKHAHINPFFLSCTRRNEHRAGDFSPMSRFSKDELEQAVLDMRALLKETEKNAAETNTPDPATESSPTGVSNDALKEDASATRVTNEISNDIHDSAVDSVPNGVSNHIADNLSNGTPKEVSVPSDIPNGTSQGASNGLPTVVPSAPETTLVSPNSDTPIVTSSSDSAIPPDPSTFANTVSGTSAQSALPSSSVPSHTAQYFTNSELTDDVFRDIWSKGDPLVVTDLLHKFRLDWTPEYFSTKYGSQGCLILECQTDQNKRVTVGDFFSWFGKYEGRRDCWKLKDWPPSTDFKSAFPELYDDFSQATPVPNYVRRDGVLNIASHFPSNTVAPDLGPKMYNAMASFEAQGSKGSTRLHMDMADAVNIMLYAAPTPDGRQGSAAWDLFKAEDSLKLRKFLRRKFKGQYQHDPIHSQQFYLDAQLRQELFTEFGVMSYRIYQKPGDAVFIPAGCAHQVCNLADCIKVASDFVSPENIDRCETLTREFREQNQSMAWKEDVLQLRTMMWFAWLSCTRQEKEMLSENSNRD
ncbi:hypothetical protein PHLCEN_2v12336 [Hermanssonia centrifuga]|uniref:JmjC domain-containing protein n=1 Tax=Hermanssonia centrifuga TaxID=98765 RepID=A0A2R6NHH1_9APHY|nr:hypothetical protein PHLCEN_2v12336 [Hermanssonia centrifuga]